MALVRCEEHRVQALQYVRHVTPVGHPRSGLVCGTESCTRPGLIWLTDREVRSYDAGTRIFSLPTAATKVQAQ